MIETEPQPNVTPTRDSLGDRMKAQYENRTRFTLPRRTYTIIRVDGKAFHTYTKGAEKPFDADIARAMDAAALALCIEAQGSAFAYVQSDEISVLLTDFATITTDAWFDGHLQKIVSVAASMATCAFNRSISDGDPHTTAWRPTALFDARAFTIPDPTEVENYFIWRQQDASRNSIQGLAQKYFSQKELTGQNTNAMYDLLFSKHGINWNDLPVEQKRGRCAVYRYSDELGRTEDGQHSWGAWFMDTVIPVFTQDREYLRARIPRYA